MSSDNLYSAWLGRLCFVPSINNVFGIHGMSFLTDQPTHRSCDFVMPDELVRRRTDVLERAELERFKHFQLSSVQRPCIAVIEQ